MNRKIFIIAVISLVADQLSKVIVDTFITLNESIAIIRNFFWLAYYHNYGAAWGILADHQYILIATAILTIVLIYRYMFTFQHNKRNNLAFGLIIGGITGNLLDRLIFRYVRDFLAFKIFGYYFPVFNISDMSLVIGVFLLIISIYKGDDRREKNQVSN